MLNVVTGRFHPHLESALVDLIRDCKRDDPFSPLAVVVPSAPLLDRVRRLLAIEHELPLLNLHLLTFHQLALRLAEERRSTAGHLPLHQVDDLFFEQVVRHVVRTRLSGVMPFRPPGSSSGTWGALWSSIRDLKDGALDPQSALRGVEEGCFDPEDRDWLRVMFSLYAAVRSAGAALNCGTADDLAESLLPHIPQSKFMASLRQVAYYGFYDLTQVQLSLFEAVAAAAPTTLFFPLDRGQAFTFATRFFERHVQPKMGGLAVRQEVEEASVGHPPTLSIYSVIGREEELAATCRAILDLYETHGYRFHDIGVVARTLDPYRTILQETFDRHRVPFSTTAGRPLIHEPLCKCLLQLASLPSNDCYRVPVLEVVASPFSRAAARYAGSAHYRPEQWKTIVSALHITHGREEWKRLEESGRAVLPLDRSDDDGSPFDRLDVAPEVIMLCWLAVSELIEACSAIPRRGNIGLLLESFKRLVVSQLAPPATGEADAESERLCAVWEAVDRVWGTLSDLDILGEEMEWSEFVDLLTHAFERAVVPIGERSGQGVMVLDAMAARGLSFKALFLLGVNDKEFPRYIREDPFLRDRHRRVLQTTLGFKIDEKLSGYDEETLLFALLCHSATQRLSLSFQRADDSGRQLAASPFLAEGAKLAGFSEVPTDTLPRRLTERVARRPTLRQWLPPREVAQWIAMRGQDPAPLLRATDGEDSIFGHALQALERLEEEGSCLTAYDGLTGPLPSLWSRLSDRGIAPTPLERYARCPFQFFASDVLRLEPARLTIAQEPEPALMGSLCHSALRNCYESLLSAGWPSLAAAPADVKSRCVEDAVTRAAILYEQQHRTGPYLLWELAKEQVRMLIAAVVETEAAAWSAEPYLPIAFEVDATGTIPVASDEHSVLKIHGRVDRVDRHRDSGAIRIMDYKYKVGGAMQPEDRNLLQSAVRGKRLQPPLYACLNLPGLGAAQEVQLLFIAPHWASPVERSGYHAATWSSESGRLIGRTLDQLLQGIREGRFPILPDSYCQTCEYRVACRREHQPTWWRSHRDADVKRMKILRTVRISHG